MRSIIINLQLIQLTVSLSTRELVDLYTLLLKLKILALFKPMDESISGIVGQLETETRFMLINSNHNIGRQNFTIAHELYHLYYDTTFKNIIYEKGLSSSEEKKADQFAGLLLMPEEGLLELIPAGELKLNTIKTSTLLTIEYSYKCSRAALLYRLRDLKLINKDYSDSKKENIESDAELYGFDLDIYQAGNHGKIVGDYLILSKDLYDNDIISETSYRKFLIDIGRERCCNRCRFL